ncbi:MAG TPA: hypothetical protein VGM82_01425 [Gemmatimonadaceae bacterium]
MRDAFVNEYLLNEYQKNFGFIVSAELSQADTITANAVNAWNRAAGNAANETVVLRGLVLALEQLGDTIAANVAQRTGKAQADKTGRIALANAATQVPLPQQIVGKRVLHFTTAFAPIVSSNKLRLDRTSDQGCIFCVPADCAAAISMQYPGNVKKIFAINGDLSHYIEFNLENSKSFEAPNPLIDRAYVKSQKELKIPEEILNLDRRDPQWYEWGGASKGWSLVPGPYAWGK